MLFLVVVTVSGLVVGSIGIVAGVLLEGTIPGAPSWRPIEDRGTSQNTKRASGVPDKPLEMATKEDTLLGNTVNGGETACTLVAL
jgi:hypothetical protein